MLVTVIKRAKKGRGMKLWRFARAARMAVIGEVASGHRE
jgi:hypothetical protein